MSKEVHNIGIEEQEDSFEMEADTLLQYTLAEERSRVRHTIVEAPETVTTFGIDVSDLTEEERAAVTSDPDTYNELLAADMKRRTETHRKEADRFRTLRDILKKSA